LCSLAQRILDAAYLCNLASDVEMDKLQAAGHLVFHKEVESLQEFA
jgi:hypothetical protein